MRSENIGYDGVKQDESKSDLPQKNEAYFKFKNAVEDVPQELANQQQWFASSNNRSRQSAINDQTD